MCVYIYMHVCMLNCVYASECVYVYTHVNVCIMYVHVFVYCVHVYVHKCVWGGNSPAAVSSEEQGQLLLGQ